MAIFLETNKSSEAVLGILECALGGLWILICVLIPQGQKGILAESSDSFWQAVQPFNVQARCLGSDQRDRGADAAEGSHYGAAAERAL